MAHGLHGFTRIKLIGKMVDFHTRTLDEIERVKDKFSNEFSGMIADEKTVQVTEEYMCTYFPGSLEA